MQKETDTKKCLRKYYFCWKVQDSSSVLIQVKMDQGLAVNKKYLISFHTRRNVFENKQNKSTK